MMRRKEESQKRLREYSTSAQEFSAKIERSGMRPNPAVRGVHVERPPDTRYPYHSPLQAG
jgi:hypothetical protein